MVIKTLLLAALGALIFAWGMTVGTNDARALAHYDAMHGCFSLGAVSE